MVLDFEKNGKRLKVAVKAFGRQGFLKDRYDFKKGSKAERSFKAANFLKSRGVGNASNRLPISIVGKVRVWWRVFIFRITLNR